MVESTREFVGTRTFNTILSAIAAIGGAGTMIAVLVGYLSAGTTNSHDIQALQSQMASLTVQVSRLSDKIDEGPRSDQMKDVDRHLSALDGRMDGMDTRIQSDERTLTKVQTQVDTIQNSSDARLTGHVR